MTFKDLRMKQLLSQKLLTMEYEKRLARNPRYSLRALARDMGLPRTTVIAVVSGKRKLSQANISKLGKCLKLEPSEMMELKNESKKNWTQLKNDLQRRTLSDEEFALIYSWHYYAILNLARLKDNKSSPKWISERLGIDVEQVKKSLQLLKKMKLLEVANGRLTRSSLPLQTKMDIPCRYIREQHRQFLYIAEESLDAVDVSLRDIASVTFCLDTRKIPEAKKMLLDFRRRLVKTLQTEQSDTVYTLSSLLFPTRTYRT